MSESLGSCEGKSITSGRTDRRAGLRICRLLKMDGFLRLKGNGIAENNPMRCQKHHLKLDLMSTQIQANSKVPTSHNSLLAPLLSLESIPLPSTHLHLLQLLRRIDPIPRPLPNLLSI